MIITITEMGEAKHVSKGKNVWSSIEVKYETDQGERSRELRSFEPCWDKAKEMEVGKTYDVTLKKDGKYWNWVDIKEAEGQKTEKKKPYTSGGSGGTWEEKNKLDRERFEFDKEKQPIIVRQSSAATAVAYFGLHPNENPTIEQVLEVAKKIEEYVYSNADYKQMEVE